MTKKSKNPDFTTSSMIDNKQKNIKIIVTPEEYEHITNEANSMKCSIRTYSKMKILDNGSNSEVLSSRIMQLIPPLYHEIEAVGDSYTKNVLKEKVGEMCRLLK